VADTATFSAAMKTKFIGPIRDILPKGKVLLFGDSDANPTDFKGILPSAENIDFVGNEFRIPMKAQRNQSVGFRSENETLPAPGNSKYTYLTEPLRYAYALFNITGQLLKASETNEGAFVSAFKQEMEDTILASKLDFNRAAYNDGSGQMAAVTNTGVTAFGTTAANTAGSTVISLASTINFRGLGEVIDFVAAAGTVLSAAHVVTGVDRTNLAIQISPGLQNTITASTHFPVRASTDSTTTTPNNSQNKEINGLANIVSNSGVLHGLNPSTYGFWKARLTAVNGPVSDAVLRDAKDGVGFEAGIDLETGLDFALITTRGIRRRYSDTLTALKRFSNAESVTLHGGFTALMFDENPIFVDDQCPVGNVYGLSLNKLFWAQMSDWDWMEEDGKVLKWEPRRDRYIAVLYKYCQLGTTFRTAHFRLTGLTDDVR
jgi:hypothetical protein